MCDSPLKNPSLVPATAGDERRVVFQNESVDFASNSNDVCEVTEVVSVLDAKERQERAEQNRLNALAILRKTFSTTRSAPPPKPSSPTTSASSMNHSNACLEVTSVVHLRQDNVIAPPPPATKCRNVFLNNTGMNQTRVNTSQLSPPST